LARILLQPLPTNRKISCGYGFFFTTRGEDVMQIMTKKTLVIALGLAVGTPAAFAAKPGTPTLGDVLEASGVSLTGYVDTSYTYLSGSGLFTSGVANRVFDTERNSFNLHAFNLTGSSLPSSGFGGLVDLSMGSDARVINAATFGTPDDGVNVTQAYVNYANGAVTVNAGKFATLAGAEVIKSPDNYNFSRGILFGFAEPATHTGVRANYALSDSTKFILGVNNGWDNLKDTNSQKTIELGASLAPAKILSLTAAIYSGTEQVGVEQGRRDLVDVVATFNVSDPLSLVVSADFGKQENGIGTSDAKWSGVAGYINYKFNPKWRAALRAEYFNDKDGFRTGLVQKWKEATLTLAYMPSKNAELRAELRGDSSDMEAFVQPDGTPKKSQQSVGLEAIYKF
jgi:hypothetical protein